MDKKPHNLLRSDIFCILPWVSLHVGTTGNLCLCCRSNYKEYFLADINDLETLGVYDFVKLRSLRRKIIDGKKIPQCQKCYKTEKNNGESLRLSFLKRENLNYFRQALGYKNIEEMLNDIYDKNGAWDKPPVYLDLKPSNKCNLRCRMCGPSSSDQASRNNSKPTKLNWMDENGNFEKIEKILPQVVQLKIGGGEPTIAENAIKLLDECIGKNYALNIKLSITTNGLMIDKLLPYAKFFKSFNVTFSIEAIGHVYEYIRIPAKWESVEANFLKMLNAKNIGISVNTIIMLDNIFYLYHDFLPWIDKMSKIRKFTVNPFIISKPGYHSPYVLPLGTRKFIVKKIKRRLNELAHIDAPTKDNFLCLCRTLEEPGFDEEKMAWGFKEFIRDHRNL